MTLQELIDFYADLLIIQYKDKPKAYATMQYLASQAISDQLPIEVQNAFDIETSVGDQLDILGKYMGISRSGNIFSGFTVLSDEDYRQILKIKIIQNNFGSSLSIIQDFLNTFFNSEIYVFDYLDMRMSYYVNVTITSTVLEFIILNDLLPRPMAVQLGATIYAADLTSFYGFRTYDHEGVNNTPMNSYEDYQTDYPWLDYDYAIIP